MEKAVLQARSALRHVVSLQIGNLHYLYLSTSDSRLLWVLRDSFADFEVSRSDISGDYMNYLQLDFQVTSGVCLALGQIFWLLVCCWQCIAIQNLSSFAVVN